MIEMIKIYGLSLSKVLLIFFLEVFALFVLFAFAQFGFIYWIYISIDNWVAVRLGFDYYVSSLVAIIFTSLFSLLMSTLAWYIFLGKKKAWGIGAIALFRF